LLNNEEGSPHSHCQSTFCCPKRARCERSASNAKIIKTPGADFRGLGIIESLNSVEVLINQEAAFPAEKVAKGSSVQIPHFC
jgi:hypothetical protein